MLETIPPDQSPERISPGKSLESEKPSGQPPSTFESYMQGGTAQSRTAPSNLSNAPGVNPTTALGGTSFQSAGVSFNSLLAQARTAQDGLGTVEQQLNTPNLKLKRSQNHLLKNKLQDTNNYINSAAGKLGVEQPQLQMPAGLNPIGRFLAYVGHGQDQLMSVQKKIKELASSQGEIRPADMLYVQIKMNQAQQEIEYSTTLLGKVIESIKTIMNTQL